MGADGFEIPCTEIGPEGCRAGDHRINASSSNLYSFFVAEHELNGEGADDKGPQKASGNGEGATAGTDSGVAEHD